MVMKYPALRFISFVIRLFGWLFLIVGLFGLGVTAGAVIGPMFGVYLPVSVSISLGVFFAVSLSVFFVGLWTLAFGELIKVLVDIALNTARA
jgi:hypothetical protein